MAMLPALHLPDARGVAQEQLTRIRTHWQAFWFELKDFHDNQRWIDLDYGSFSACVESELGLSKQRAAQLLDAAIVREELSSQPGLTTSLNLNYLTERHARELKGVPAPLRIEIARQVDFSTTPIRELRKIVQAAKVEITERKADQPPAPAKPIPDVLPADVALYCDDARSLSLYVANVDLILTSPPYGLDKEYPEWQDDPAKWEQFMGDWLGQAFAVTRDAGRLALNIPLDTTRGGFRPTYAQAITAALAVGWQYRASIVWNEGNITHSVGRGSVDSPNSPHVIAPVEMVALFSKGDWDRKRQGQASDLSHAEWLEWTNGLWTFPGESRAWEGHPAAFPDELPRRLIKLLSFPGDLVCDPFLGSGTSALVAARLGRKFVGIDQSDIYIASTRRRLVGI